jgi:chromosomal replication initiation ATPase DnaA
MRIRSLDAQNVPPVKEFRVDSISDVLVIAGPNGVGKTRLIAAILQAFQNPNPSNSVKMQIEATSPEVTSPPKTTASQN